jgi:hypothetical protein
MNLIINCQLPIINFTNKLWSKKMNEKNVKSQGSAQEIIRCDAYAQKSSNGDLKPKGNSSSIVQELNANGVMDKFMLNVLLSFAGFEREMIEEAGESYEE